MNRDVPSLPELSVLNAITDAFTIFDKNWNFIFINKPAQKFSSQPIENLIGKNLHKVVPTFKTSQFFKEYKLSMRIQKPHTFEAYYKPLNKWLEVHLYPSKEYLLIYYTDYTDKKRMSDELYFKSDIVKNITHSVMATDLDGNIIFWNEGATDLYGFTAEEMMGTSPAILYPGHENTKDLKKILTKAKQKDYFLGKGEAIKKDGTVIWVERKISLMKNKDGKPIGFLGISRNITEQKNIEDNLRFLSQASKLLSSSLDYKKTIKSVSKLAISYMADWFFIDLFDEQDVIDLVAVGHKDPKKIKWAYEMRKMRPVNLESNVGIAQVVRTGKSQLYPHITHDLLESSDISNEQRDIVKNIGFSSLMFVPLIIRKKVIGVITFATTHKKRSYNESDLSTAEELATRASLAIENARLYHDAAAARERMDNLIANVPGVVWESYGEPDATKQRVNYVSDYIETMMGYSKSEWLQMPQFWMEIAHPEDTAKVRKEAEKFFNSGKGGTMRFRIRKKNGQYIWVEVQTTIIKDTNGLPVGMRGVTMDISERVKLEEKKDEFISIASHELKTPLTSAKGYLQILSKRMRTAEDGTLKQLVDKSNRYLDKLNNLISDLLDVSKIQSGKLQLTISDFDVFDLITEVVESLQPTICTHTIIIQRNVHRLIAGDKERLEQVLANLITNAVKYSPGSEKINIFVDEEDKYIQISVEDYGVGIPEKDKQYLFQRFYRVEDTSKRFSGMGIGLYISSEIVKRHNGTISVASKVNQGSTFTFCIPFKAK
ncbi:PAS domain S-box protein [Candidatus Woesebacteria bacterium]|nr:PAS domain S-box protein [Candidatus Woesebacteria bacterium]